MQEQEWQVYVDQAFNRMDLDGDGYIDLDELLSELPPSYFQDPANEDERIAEAKRMLREADENGDGRISKQVWMIVVSLGVCFWFGGGGGQHMH
jgi:calcium-dependent protein kinase